MLLCGLREERGDVEICLQSHSPVPQSVLGDVLQLPTEAKPASKAVTSRVDGFGRRVGLRQSLTE